MNVEEVQLAVKTFEAPANTQNGKSVQELLKMFMTNQYQHRYRSMLKRRVLCSRIFLELATYHNLLNPLKSVP